MVHNKDVEVYIMKKITIITCILSLYVLTACNNDSAVEGLYNESGNTINVNNQRSDIYNQNREKDSPEFGYVRHQKSPTAGEQMSVNHASVFDREKIADAISKLCTALPNVDDVSTLVTDEEVLIVYNTEADDRNLTADQVKKTAMSFVPRSYHVYVSDDTSLRKNVESFSTMTSGNGKKEYAIDKLIKDMKKSPQGEKLNNDENANGETKEDRK